MRNAAGSMRATNGAGDDEHGASPIHPRNQPGGERRHCHRRHAEPGRDQRNGKTALGLEPARHRRHQGRQDRRDRDANQRAEAKLKLEEARRAACERQAHAEQDRAGQHDGPRPNAVDEQSPAEAGGGHREEADRHRARDAGPRPAGRRGQRHKKHRQAEHRADRDAAKKAARGDDHPAVRRLRHRRSPISISRTVRTSRQPNARRPNGRS